VIYVTLCNSFVNEMAYGPEMAAKLVGFLRTGTNKSHARLR